MKKCSDNLNFDGNFEVVDIELLTLDENPRSKCWRVAVPYKCKDLMLPCGWWTRRFFGGRGKISDKRQQVSQDVEQMVINQERKDQELKQKQAASRLAGSSEGGPLSSLAV